MMPVSQIGAVIPRFGAIYHVRAVDETPSPIPLKTHPTQKPLDFQPISSPNVMIATQVLHKMFVSLGIPAILLAPDMIVTPPTFEKMQKALTALQRQMVDKLPAPERRAIAEESPVIKRLMDTRRLGFNVALDNLLDMKQDAYPVLLREIGPNQFKFVLQPWKRDDETYLPPKELLEALNTMSRSQKQIPMTPE